MRNLMNSDQSYTGLVEKYIGSAFDKVRLVADNIEMLQLLALIAQDGNIEKLVKLQPELQGILDQIAGFRNTYYGPLSGVPTTRPDKSAIRNGDMYYDTDKNLLMVRMSGNWIPVGADDIGVEVIKVTSAMQTGNDFLVPLSKSYVPDTNNIMVFVNSAFQYALNKEHPDGAYVEKSSTSLLFPNTGLQVNDLVVVVRGGMVTTTSHTVGVELEQYTVLMPGETDVLLPGGMTYNPGLNNLEVFLNGLRLISGRDYHEISETKVEFLSPLAQNDHLLFKKGNVITSGVLNAGSPVTGAAGNIRVLKNAGEFFGVGNSLNRDEPVLLQGYAQPADGGAGVFLYKAALDRRTANGGTLIDVSVPLSQQGTGAGTGLWERQYEGTLSLRWFGLSADLVSDMLSIKPSRDGDRVTVNGLLLKGDGGAGEFEWAAQMPKSKHDGGAILDPNIPMPTNWDDIGQVRSWFQTRGTSTGNGCWVRTQRLDADIRWFGADSTNTRENALVLEGVGKAISAKNIRKLYIPAGTYSVNQPYVMDVTDAVDGFVIYGDGRQSNLVFGTTSATSPIVFRNVAGLTVSNLSLESKSGNPQNGLTLMNVNRSLVSQVYCKNFMGAGIQLTKDTFSNTATACSEITISHNRLESCGTAVNGAAILVDPGMQSDSLNINDNIILKSGALRAGSAYINASIFNNEIEDSLANAIEISAYESVDVFSNNITRQMGAGVLVNLAPTVSYTSPTYAGLAIRHNHVQNSANLAGTSGYAIELIGGVGITGTNGLINIENNNILNTPGIICKASSKIENIVIRSNQINGLLENQTAIELVNTNGYTPSNVILVSNMLDSGRVNRQGSLVRMVGAKDSVIESNYFNRGGKSDLTLQDCGGTSVLQNTFTNSNSAKAAGVAIIEIVDNNTTDYWFRNNMIVVGSYGDPKYLVNASTANPRIRILNTGIPKPDIQAAVPGITNVISDGSNTDIQMGSARHFRGPGIPTTGSYVMGDVMWNSAPNVAAAIGWVCVTAGTPGTWKSFGTISA